MQITLPTHQRKKCAVVPSTPLLWHLRQTHSLLIPTLSSRTLLPGFLQGLICFLIPMRMKRDAKINSQGRGILLTLDGSPCIPAQAGALNSLERLLGSTSGPDPQCASTAPVTSSVLPQLLADTDPAHCLRQQIS